AEREDAVDLAEEAAVVVRRRAAGAELDAEVAGDAGDAGAGDVEDEETRLATADPERRDAAAGREEDRHVGGAELDQEAAVHVTPLGRGRIGERARVVERRAADDLEEERDGCELERLALAARQEDRVAVLVLRCVDPELLAVRRLDPPLLAGGD